MVYADTLFAMPSDNRMCVDLLRSAFRLACRYLPRGPLYNQLAQYFILHYLLAHEFPVNLRSRQVWVEGWTYDWYGGHLCGPLAQDPNQ